MRFRSLVYDCSESVKVEVANKLAMLIESSLGHHAIHDVDNTNFRARFK